MIGVLPNRIQPVYYLVITSKRVQPKIIRISIFRNCGNKNRIKKAFARVCIGNHSMAFEQVPLISYAHLLIFFQMGRVNVFITALAMYAVRYIGYSFITNPWMAFPFEALELFTNNLMRVAAVQYVGAMAPKGKTRSSI